ncbi:MULTISPECIES: SDR family oxidoreductase [unclassified Exiguobacterium]|uniref:SDR family oxidoreductase n=1 Tax=unclassified Exiguobacterium TaxID=2644629 RepID=UPI001BE64AD2|nr:MULTISPECIES: SDR family oxidoreductase [unclassified Exiguobacterium]
MKLSGKTAIITGAGSGMGRAIAKLFAKECARIVAFDLDEDGVQAVVEEIKTGGGDVVGIAGNVTNQSDIDRLIDTTKDTFGSVDILVNNAGIMDNFMTVGEVTDELWDRVLAVNLTGPMKLARAAIQVMEKQDHGGVNTNIGATITAPSELGMRAIQGAGEAPMGEPEQIASVALFLASDDSSFVNGDVLKADGGWTAR